MSRIYLSPPHLSGKEQAYVQDAIESGWIAPLGPYVDAFERDLAEWVGVPAAAALSSGTGGLHLALLLMGVQPGDEVLCPTLTFAASANAITYCGAQPAFLDVEPGSWNLDPALLEAELEERNRENRLPKAVLVVDLYGQTADYDRIEALCERFEIPVIEDAAEALGSTYKGRPAGSFGRVAVLSFNGNKILTTSGGGALLSHDPELVAKARFLATQARDPAPHYQHSTIGFNYRLSNLLAAVGRAQMEVLEDRVARRRANFDFYQDALGELPGVQFMPEPDWSRSNRWLTCVLLEPEAFGATREDVRLALEAENIEARPVWKPMHLQPVFANAPIRGGAVAEALFENGLCLPSGSNLSTAELERIATIVRNCSRA